MLCGFLWRWKLSIKQIFMEDIGDLMHSMFFCLFKEQKTDWSSSFLNLVDWTREQSTRNRPESRLKWLLGLQRYDARIFSNFPTLAGQYLFICCFHLYFVTLLKIVLFSILFCVIFILFSLHPLSIIYFVLFSINLIVSPLY